MCFLQAEVYFVLVFSVYKYFRICQNKRKCSYTSGFFEGVITFSIECMYIYGVIHCGMFYGKNEVKSLSVSLCVREQQYSFD